jgi:hypothetical protein
MDRSTGKTINLRDALSHRQLLSNTEEQVLAEWADLMSTKADPLSAVDLCKHAFALTGKHPGKKWH